MNPLRKMRSNKGLSQVELAKRSGVSACAISGIESGKHVPQFVTLRALADALGIEVSDFHFFK